MAMFYLVRIDSATLKNSVWFFLACINIFKIKTKYIIPVSATSQNQRKLVISRINASLNLIKNSMQYSIAVALRMLLR